MIPVRDTAPSRYPSIMMWVLIGINVVVFVITYEVAKKMGLNASDQMPAEILELMDLYPQPVRTKPSVTYLPSRRRASEEAESS